MKFRLSMFVDAFLGSGVPLSGDPITSFQVVPLLGLRTGTISLRLLQIVGVFIGWKSRSRTMRTGPIGQM
jgi:hypothetical protein